MRRDRRAERARLPCLCADRRYEAEWSAPRSPAWKGEGAGARLRRILGAVVATAVLWLLIAFVLTLG